MHGRQSRRITKSLIAASLICLASLAANAQSITVVDKTLPATTRFFVPQPQTGAPQQALSLLQQHQFKNAVLLTAMMLTPQAVWLTTNSTAADVTKVLREANLQRAVPVFVVYNIPGRDCGGYSGGGAQTTAAYESYIDAIAGALGNHKAVIFLEPDALALLPTDCGLPQSFTDDRYAQINYAVSKLEAQPQTLVYLDAGHSAWHAVGDMAVRLVQGGVMNTQGFYSNVSNYQATDHEVKFDTWISECIAFANSTAEGGWRLGHYSWCASQYYPANPSDFSTWTLSDQWYASNLGTAVPTTHFLIDTSRNGQGPFNASSYASAPYDQPSWAISALNSGSWCNPPARGLGLRPTANTGVALLDAYLWAKIPGASDGQCAAAGGARGWDYSVYNPWNVGVAQQPTFDPLWGLVDPVAGAWFPQQALDLAQRANPPLLP